MADPAAALFCAICFRRDHSRSTCPLAFPEGAAGASDDEADAVPFAPAPSALPLEVEASEEEEDPEELVPDVTTDEDAPFEVVASDEEEDPEERVPAVTTDEDAQSDDLFIPITDVADFLPDPAAPPPSNSDSPPPDAEDLAEA